MKIRSRSAAVVAVLGVLTAMAVGAAPSAQATTASSGQRCTIVGTPGNDRLVGTSRNDVICGLGGNDVITGAGGNDVIDGGAGNDVIDAGSGTDSVLGGLGNDLLWGSGGSDRLVGGSGSDTVTYADRTATVTADLDGARDDGAVGERDQIGTDVENLVGGTGSDTLTGSAGVNTISGGAGADRVSGGSGNDSLTGGSGDDNVVGGPGADSLNGGGGENFCDTDRADRVVLACLSDSEAPEIVSVSVVGDATLTSGTASLDVVVQATDDLSGVGYVVLLAKGPGDSSGAYAWAHLPISTGSARSSTWRGTLTLTSSAPSGLWSVYMVQALDLGGNSCNYDVRGQEVNARPLPTEGRTSFTVVNPQDPDIDPPVISDLQLSSTVVDVTGTSQTVHVSARVQDARSDVARVWLIGHGPGPYQMSRTFAGLQETSAGFWEGDATLPADLGHGYVWLTVQAMDAAGNDGWSSAGEIEVVSADEDVQPPTLVDVEIRTPLVTKAVSTNVTVRVAVEDRRPLRGEQYSLQLCRPDGLQVNISGAPREVSRSADGTRVVFEETIPLPEAAPRGTYTVCGVSVADEAWNQHLYVTSAVLAQWGTSWMWTASPLLDQAPGIVVR